ncbi:MAG: hypothetical protein ACLPTZ_07310 [Beijerinckiaceae bacterium]
MSQQRVSTNEQQSKQRGRPWPPGVSGNLAGRALRGKRFGELFDGLAADFGGASGLTPAQAIMLSQAVRLLMRAERERTAEDTVRLSNAAVRMLSSLRNGRRKPAVPALEAHLDKLAREHAGEDNVIDDDAPAQSEAVA